jgi:ABC-2 type transport system permease protein
MAHTDTLARTPGSVLQPAGHAPTTVIGRLVARRAVRSVIAWGYVFAAYVVGSISGFALTYKTQAAREQLARSFGANVGLQALIGPARHIDTVAGFAAWRTGVTLTVIGAVWGLLASTRLLRGEEEAGRWELLLSGQTTRRRAAAQGVAGLAAGWLVLFAVTTIATVADGRTVHPALPARACAFYALSITCGAAMFLAVGAFTSQLARTRRRAATIAGAVLGVAYMIRMVADAGTTLGWLRWASPLGWVEELRPLVGTHLLPLGPIGAFTVALAVLAVRLAGARDVGDGVLPERDTARARTRLLNGPTGLGLRLLRGTAVAWLVAVAGLGFVEGLIAKGAAVAVTGSAAVERALGRLGGRNGGVVAYLGLSFLITAIALTLVAAGQAAANREEEATGRLDNLLVRPVGRWSWLAGRLAVEAVILLILGLVAGAATWIGAATQHSGVGFGSLLQGGLNAVPPALFLLGAATLVHGAVPRLVTPVTYGLIAWSFLVEFVGSVINMSHWVLDTSILYHLAPAPAAPPRWGSAAVMVALGAAGALGGAALFRRRDLISA